MTLYTIKCGDPSCKARHGLYDSAERAKSIIEDMDPDEFEVEALDRREAMVALSQYIEANKATEEQATKALYEHYDA